MVSAPADEKSGLEKLNANERTIWREAVAAYATSLSKKDMVFDDPLPELTSTLALADDSKSLALSKVDSTIEATLQKSAPIYRKAWWKQHRDANRKMAKERSSTC